MTFKINFWHLIELVTVFILALYLFKSCNRESAYKIALVKDKRINDSLQESGNYISCQKDSILKSKVANDSIAELVINSLNDEISILQGRYVKTQNKVSALTVQLRSSYLAHDTISLFSTYDSLRAAIHILENQYFAVQLSRDSLDYVKSQDISRLNGVIKSLDSSFNNLKYLYNSDLKLNNDLINASIKEDGRQKKLATWHKIELGLAIVGGFMLGNIHH